MHFIDDESNSEFYKTGMNAISNNEVAVITFSGGTGSRWTHGSAVAKAINPFLKVEGKYRTFLEQHIAKSRKTGKLFRAKIQHVFTTSYLTHDAIEHFLKVFDYFDYEGHIYLSQAKSIGNRVYPMERDLRFLWEEQIQQKLDENSQKLLDNIHNALIDWVKSRGEGRDYSENKYITDLIPRDIGMKIPNLIKNGCLASMLKDNPNLKYLFCHNIDTMGAYIEPVLLGMHVNRRSCLTFEVTPRRIEDQGGGLAKVNGSIQLIEGLAIPVEEDEYKLSYIIPSQTGCL
jgi:UDP-N-acetylglucosamine pyrophosphorylase